MNNPAQETPQQAARRLAASFIADGFRPEALHVYRDADGDEHFCKFRLKHPETGEKLVRPMHRDGRSYKLGEPAFSTGKKLLYRLDEICANPAAVVWIVEGEKCADALAKCGVIATTSGGADSALQADWEPLRERECIIWCDNDDAGKGYGRDVVSILIRLDCTIKTVDVERLGLPPKADAWDWMQTHKGATQADLANLPLTPPSSEPNDLQGNPASGPMVELISGDKVKPQAIEWLWNGYLAAGKLHIVAGAPGTGKTTIAVAVAATLTKGGRWPDGTVAPTGDVIVWSGEDSINDTLAPRLLAAGADMRRVHFVHDVVDGGTRRPFDPATDFATLARAAVHVPELRLMVVDPIASAVAADSHKNSETRRGLQPLVDFAETIGCALLGVTHFTKGTQGREPLERVTGSLAFGAMPRIVLATAKLKEDGGGGRVLVRAKSNIGLDGGGFRYELRQEELPGEYNGIIASRVEWCGPVDGTASTILAVAEQDTDPDEKSELRDASDWLRARIEDAGGEMARRELLQEAEQAGFPERTIQRAKKRAGVITRQTGFGAAKQSTWMLAESPIVPIVPDEIVGTDGTNGHVARTQQPEEPQMEKEKNRA